MIAAEAESQTPVTAIDDDILRTDALMHPFGIAHVEGEKVTAGNARGRHEVVRREHVDAKAKQPIEEVLLDAHRVEVHVLDGGAGGSEPVHRRVEAIEPRRIEGGAPEAERVVRVGNRGAGRYAQRIE